ncbi:small ribosomal subunit protein mS25 [Centruroides vittatus]|uniref:small ribosomal subunit protein mS25 n=1 Tax=Centruroides vittatus TaxID=120091 RepID=UPI00350EC62E
MPFKIGPAPIRRTLQYLQKGRLVFKDRVKIFSINFNADGDLHRGARDFVFWHLAQLQYKNPNIQVVVLNEMTPNPFIRCWFEDLKDVVVDIEGKTKDEILNHLIRILGKSDDILAEEEKQKEKKDNPANFGRGCDRHCMCEIPGQVPCPGVVVLPKHMRGKFRNLEE